MMSGIAEGPKGKGLGSCWFSYFAAGSIPPLTLGQQWPWQGVAPTPLAHQEFFRRP